MQALVKTIWRGSDRVEQPSSQLDGKAKAKAQSPGTERERQLDNGWKHKKKAWKAQGKAVKAQGKAVEGQ